MSAKQNIVLCKEYKFKIVDIEWERVFLKIKVEGNYLGIPEFVLSRFKRVNGGEGAHVNTTVSVKPVDVIKGTYIFKLHMAAINNRTFLENGQWRLCAMLPEGMCVVSVDNSIGYKLEAMERVFRYGKNKYAYNVSFSIGSADGSLELFLNSYFMKINNEWKKRKYVEEASSTLKGKLRGVCKRLTINSMRLFYWVFSRITPKDGSRVLFMTETKPYIWGNLKYIDNRIKERNLDRDFKISYSCRRSVGSHMSAWSWVKVFWLLARQDFIFVDDYAPVFGFIRLHPRTTLIQVWHAGEGFKSVGYSRFGRDGSPHPTNSPHKAYTYALTGSERLVDVYSEVFGIERESILPLGMARLDGFLDEGMISEFREGFYDKYPQFRGKKIILFAPTFRGRGQKEARYDYNMLDLGEIYRVCGSEYVVLVKMHPFIKKSIDIPKEYKDRIYDFSFYQNINDLYYVTDLLITDYSSNYYEYALMERPVLFYTYDREIYELTRGVHRSVKESAPGKVCDTFEELISAIENKDFEEWKLKDFVVSNFKDYDGHASDKVIDRILLGKHV